MHGNAAQFKIPHSSCKFCSVLFRLCNMTFSDAAKAKPETRKERKEAKLLNKLKSGTRKSSSSLSPSKKEKSSAAAAAPPSEESTANQEALPAGGYSPVQKHFQRTLSPADVLHVHSYAKGDYGEGEAALKEEKKADETEEHGRHHHHPVGQHLSESTPPTHCLIQCCFFIRTTFTTADRR